MTAIHYPRSIRAALAAAVLATVAVPGAVMAERPKVATAIQLAERASAATTIPEARSQLHALINCVEGERSTNFDAASPALCGPEGALGESAGLEAASLRAATSFAKLGVGAESLTVAKAAAELSGWALKTPGAVAGLADMVAPAKSTTGTLVLIDNINKMVRVDGDWYAAAGIDLHKISEGQSVLVTYVTKDGKRFAMDIQPALGEPTHEAG